MRFPSISIDALSFLIGVLIATIFWWLMERIRPLWKEARAARREKREEAKAQRSTGVEDNFRRTTYRRAQGMHLAAPLFALDEILEPPRLMAPPARVIPDAPPFTEDITARTLPFMPGWPELAGLYQAATLEIPRVLENGLQLVITGNPGAGKTVALAYMASLLSNRDPRMGKLVNHIPFLYHVADLQIPDGDIKNALKPIEDAASEHAPVFDLGRIPRFVQYAFQNGRALFLLDGYDELHPQEKSKVSNFLSALFEQYPQAQVVLTAHHDQLQGLAEIGFEPMPIMSWKPPQRKAFFERWGKIWMETVAVEAWAQSELEHTDSLLINSWLDNDNHTLSPLELTLKVWAAYAGDSLGHGVLDAIATHIRRLAPRGTPLAAMETLGMQVALSAHAFFEPRSAREWVKSFEVAEEEPEEEIEEDEEGAEGESPEKETKPGLFSRRSKAPKKKALPTTTGLLGKMAASGLLTTHRNNRMRFLHPVLGGYLAGRAMSGFKAEEALLEQDEWVGRTLAMQYIAAHGDASALAEAMLAQSSMPLQRPLFIAGRWLRDAPQEAKWRSKVFSALADLLQTEGVPLALRGQAMAAFCWSGDPGVASLFRQFLQTPSFDLIQLTALGCGAIRDFKSVEQLSNILHAPSSSAQRAACLALVHIGDPAGLETVTRALLEGEEDLRRAAAESLANDPQEGYEILREGITHKDILLRHAVVYGLARIEQDWATEALELLQVEDEQWVVRNSSSEVLESRTQTDPRIPQSLTPPSETPWLIELASKQGAGISPGSPATEVLIGALTSDREEDRLAVLPYLRRMPSENLIEKLYEGMYGEEIEFREAVFLILFEFAARGVELPDPRKFGFS